jgi:hypothetical protein
MSAPSQAIAPNPLTNLLNVYVQSVNKMGVQKKNVTQQILKVRDVYAYLALLVKMRKRTKCEQPNGKIRFMSLQIILQKG